MVPWRESRAYPVCGLIPVTMSKAEWESRWRIGPTSTRKTWPFLELSFNLGCLEGMQDFEVAQWKLIHPNTQKSIVCLDESKESGISQEPQSHPASLLAQAHLILYLPFKAQAPQQVPKRHTALYSISPSRLENTWKQFWKRLICLMLLRIWKSWNTIKILEEDWCFLGKAKESLLERIGL